MNKPLGIILLALMCLVARAGSMDEMSRISYPGGKCYLYRVYLSDKKGTSYTLLHPEAFLSLRALKRRACQHIMVDSTDLPISSVYISAIKGKGFQIVNESKWNNTVVIKTRSVKALNQLAQFSFVRKMLKVFTSPDSIDDRQRSSFHKQITSLQHDDKSFYGVAAKQIMSLKGDSLHLAGYRGESMLIAVLDGGFMNVDCIPVMQLVKIVGTADFVWPPSINIYKEMDHGTMVLSTMAVDVPHVYVGTAPKASYLLLRSEDERTESLVEEDHWAEAVEYADSAGVDVINSSLGYHEFDDESTSHKYCELDGNATLISHTASMLASKGIILVNSAGNDGMGSWKKINVPADAKNIITVGAITPEGINSPFSSIGPTADGRVKPDVMAYGSPAVVTGRGTIINDMGTSFSSPIVAGLVTCLWQAFPELNAYDIISLVIRSSDRYNSPNNIFGYGVPDFWKAYQMGRKMVNSMQ